MRKIKDYIMRRIVGARAAKKARHDAEIAARFRIAERGGKIFLLCYGTAVAVVDDYSNAVEITRQIKSARNAAIDYEKQCLVQPANASDNGNE